MESALYWVSIAVSAVLVPILTAWAVGTTPDNWGLSSNIATSHKSADVQLQESVPSESPVAPGSSGKKAKWKRKKAAALRRAGSSASCEMDGGGELEEGGSDAAPNLEPQLPPGLGLAGGAVGATGAVVPGLDIR